MFHHPGIQGYRGTDAPASAFAVTSRDVGGHVYGYFVAPEGSQLTSESGPMSSETLSRFGARLSDYEPGSMSVEDVAHVNGTSTQIVEGVLGR